MELKDMEVLRYFSRVNSNAFLDKCEKFLWTREV